MLNITCNYTFGLNSSSKTNLLNRTEPFSQIFHQLSESFPQLSYPHWRITPANRLASIQHEPGHYFGSVYQMGQQRFQRGWSELVSPGLHHRSAPATTWAIRWTWWWHWRTDMPKGQLKALTNYVKDFTNFTGKHLCKQSCTRKFMQYLLNFVSIFFFFFFSFLVWEALRTE